jgi:hypothetical protein
LSSRAAHRVPRSFYAGILLCSVGVLMQEILLTRIFSFTIWYHLAYLTIGTALLGFGAAGTIAAMGPAWVARNPPRAAALCAAAAGLALLVAMLVLAPRPMSPDRLLSEPGRFAASLLGYYLLVTAPFLLAGLAVVIPLAFHPQRVDRLYAADLLGAGLGCAAAVAALSYTDASAAIVLCAACFLAAGVCYAPGLLLRIGLGAGAGLLVYAAPHAHKLLIFEPTATKALGRALAADDTEILFTRWSPVNRVDLYRGGGRRSFWASSGLAPGYAGPQPEILHIQYDGHNGTDVYRDIDDSMQMLDVHLLRTPYLLLEAPRVLVIGVVGGIDVANAARGESCDRCRPPADHDRAPPGPAARLHADLPAPRG